MVDVDFVWITEGEPRVGSLDTYADDREAAACSGFEISDKVWVTGPDGDDLQECAVKVVSSRVADDYSYTDIAVNVPHIQAAPFFATVKIDLRA